jgi:hypothetical protein
MTEQEAIAFATAEVVRLKKKLHLNTAKAVRKDRHMRLGKDRTGWLVCFEIVGMEDFDPSMLLMEVYEPDGEVLIPDLL